jgi:DNA-binding IclR family transcriptional regulator
MTQQRDIKSDDVVGYPLVPAVTKAINIIRLLNERHHEGLSLAVIADELGITRSHCHGILRTLIYHRWVQNDPNSKVYRLTPTLCADTSSGLVSRPHLGLIQPLVKKLADDLGFPCVLCEPIDDGSFLVVFTAHYPDPFVFNVPIGYRFPPGTPPQMKARLAWLPEETWNAVLSTWKPVQYTKNTILDPSAMLQELRMTRERGYARSVGEFVDGFTTILLPIFDRFGEIILILYAAGATSGLEPKEEGVVRALVKCVFDIHGVIDGRPPARFPQPRA